MIKKLSRRKKIRPAKTRRSTFRITVEAQPMVVSYEPDYFAGMAHFEFRSPHKPLRCIPVSETSYRSNFVPMDEVKAASSPEEFAREEVVYLFRSQCQRPADPRAAYALPVSGLAVLVAAIDSDSGKTSR
jgi:hypothetical protein